MAKALRFTRELYNTPHLISEEGLHSVLSYLEMRNSGEPTPEMGVMDSGKKSKREATYDSATKTGVLSIEGPLTYKPTGMEAMCGGMSYEQLVSDMKQFVQFGASTVVVDFNSPGGQAYACFEEANYVRQLADENNIRLIGYVDGSCASAAYGWGAVCHELIANPDSSVGSIGVVVKLMNDSKALEKAGIERTFIYAGDNKVPFDEDGKFTKEFKDDIQASVDTMYENFTYHVADWRNLSEKSVKGTQAKMFRADEALKLGLVDKVMKRQEFLQYLSASAAGMENKEPKQMPIGNLFTTKKPKAEAEAAKTTPTDTTKEELSTMDEKQVAEMQAQLAALTAKLEQTEATMTNLASVAAQAQAQAAALEAEKKLAIETARKEQLTSVLGTAKLDAVYSATAGLSDAQFSAVVDAMKTSRKEEEKSVLFTEAGYDMGEQKMTFKTDLEKQAELVKAQLSAKFGAK